MATQASSVTKLNLQGESGHEVDELVDWVGGAELAKRQWTTRRRKQSSRVSIAAEICESRQLLSAAVNTPPDANDDYLTVHQGDRLHFTIGTAPDLVLLQNDTDAETRLKNPAVVSGPAYGNLTRVGPWGGITYYPAPGFVGTDSFVYSISDGEFSDTATVYIAVGNQEPVATPDSYITPINASIVAGGNAADDLLANDWDPDNVTNFTDSLRVTGVTINPANGVVDWIGPYGGFKYTPNSGFIGNDNFTYEITDGAEFATATVSIEVQPVDISVGDVNVTEGDSAQLQVTLSRPAGHDIGIRWSVPSNLNAVTSTTLASAGTDYSGPYSKTLWIPKGNVTGLITLQTIDDDRDESDTESLVLTLASASGGASITDSEGAISIADNDDNHLPVPKPGGNEDSDNDGIYDRYRVIYGGALDLDASESVDTDGDPLTYRWDLNGDLTNWELTGAQPTVTWDALIATYNKQAGTTFTVTLEVDDGKGSSADAAFRTASISVKLLLPTVSISSTDINAIEGHRAGPQPGAVAALMDKASFTLSRSNTTTDVPLTVWLDNSRSTATPTSDYTLSSAATIINSLQTKVVIPAGKRTVTVYLNPVEDEEYREGDETIVFDVVTTLSYGITTPSVSITLSDLNRAPHMTDRTLRITRNAIGKVLNVNATDPDPGHNIASYTKSGTDPFLLLPNGDIYAPMSGLTSIIKETAFIFSITATDDAPNPKSTTRTFTIIVTPIWASLSQVNFSDTFQYLPDPNVSATGTTTNTASNYIEWTPYGSKPLAYSSGANESTNRWKATAKIDIDDAWGARHTTLIRANHSVYGTQITGNLATWTDGGGSGASNYLLATVSSYRKFNRQVAYEKTFTLTWQISIDGGTTWIDVGESSNELYLTLAAPLIAPRETVLYTGCIAAAGATFDAQVFDSIWTHFKQLNIIRKSDGKPLSYGHSDIAGSTTESLIQNRVGRCDSWSNFFVDTLRTQGYTRGLQIKEMRVDGTWRNPITGNWNGDEFLVEAGTWVFNDKTGDPTGYDASLGTYHFVVAGDRNEDECHQVGQAGRQGLGATAATRFYNHFVVIMGGRIYDPSYGTEADSLADFEDRYVEGYGKDSNNITFASQKSLGEHRMRWY